MNYLHVFVSHAEEDRPAAGALMRALPEAGAMGFSYLFTPPPPGVHFPTYISGAINNAHVLVFLWSQHAMTSSYMAYELTTAQETNKIVVPVMLENIQLPPQVGSTQAIRAFEDPSGWVLQVRNTVNHIRSTTSPGPTKKKGLFSLFRK